MTRLKYYAVNAAGEVLGYIYGSLLRITDSVDTALTRLAFLANDLEYELRGTVLGKARDDQYGDAA